MLLLTKTFVHISVKVMSEVISVLNSNDTVALICEVFDIHLVFIIFNLRIYPKHITCYGCFPLVIYFYLFLRIENRKITFMVMIEINLNFWLLFWFKQSRDVVNSFVKSFTYFIEEVFFFRFWSFVFFFNTVLANCVIALTTKM